MSISSELAGQIAYRFATLMDGGATAFGEAHRRVESIRRRIGWLAVDFANHQGMALLPGTRPLWAREAGFQL